MFTSIFVLGVLHIYVAIAIIIDTIAMILTDVTGDDTPKPMTKDLLRKIFIFYKEHDVAENDELLEEMISVASDLEKMKGDGDEEVGAGDKPPLLDAFTFAHCLTDDVRTYDVKSEGRLSTNFSDVFCSSDKDDQQEEEDEVLKVKTAWTAPSIDYAVDTFRSKSYVILL